MSGLPRTSGKNTTGKCTGDWAGHTSEDDDQCCNCWWDDLGPCCQCDAGTVEPKPWPRRPLPKPENCIICNKLLGPDDPAVTILGARCAGCWSGHTSQLGRR